MLYVGDEWLIQPTKDKGTNKAYVRLKCETPNYPELRLEGSKGLFHNYCFYYLHYYILYCNLNTNSQYLLLL